MKYVEGTHSEDKRENKNHAADEETVPLPCPVCGARLIDASRWIEVEVSCAGKSAVKRYLKYFDFYQKCWKCKSLIGLRKVKAEKVNDLVQSTVRT